MIFSKCALLAASVALCHVAHAGDINYDSPPAQGIHQAFLGLGGMSYHPYPSKNAYIPTSGFGGDDHVNRRTPVKEPLIEKQFQPLLHGGRETLHDFHTPVHQGGQHFGHSGIHGGAMGFAGQNNFHGVQDLGYQNDVYPGAFQGGFGGEHGPLAPFPSDSRLFGHGGIEKTERKPFREPLINAEQGHAVPVRESLNHLAVGQGNPLHGFPPSTLDKNLLANEHSLHAEHALKDGRNVHQELAQHNGGIAVSPPQSLLLPGNLNHHGDLHSQAILSQQGVLPHGGVLPQSVLPHGGGHLQSIERNQNVLPLERNHHGEVHGHLPRSGEILTPVARYSGGYTFHKVPLALVEGGFIGHHFGTPVVDGVVKAGVPVSLARGW